MKIITQTILLIALHLIAAKQFDDCEFAIELYVRHQVPRDDIYKHFCIANTLHTTKDQHTFKGIYAIGSLWWCGHDVPGGGCNVKCSDLLDDDIADDVTCANLILSQQGVNGWSKNETICKRKYAQKTDDCLATIDLLNDLTGNESEIMTTTIVTPTTATVTTIEPTMTTTMVSSTTVATTIAPTTTEKLIDSFTSAAPAPITSPNQSRNSTNENEEVDIHSSPHQTFNVPSSVECSCATQNILLSITVVVLVCAIAAVLFKYRHLKRLVSSAHNKEYEEHLI